MFFAPSKLFLILLVAFAVWYATRWLNGPARNSRAASRPKAHWGVRYGAARAQPAPPPPPAIEDLVACHSCGAYVATGARGCGKPGCPQPR